MLVAEDPTLPRHAPSATLLRKLQRAYTPLRRSEFERELINYPDKAHTSWLLDAIDNGVTLGYTGPRTHIIFPNLLSAKLHSAVIDQELFKECAAGRILGPYTTQPLPNLRCSGLGAVPKKNGKWRVIMHLSAPIGNSVNDFIAPEDFSLHYATIDDAIRLIMSSGRGTLMAKVDLKSAFRMVPVHHSDWELLGIFWQDQYFIDTCLPFGCRSSPFLFNQFAEALQWILSNNYHVQLIHYLDDFLLVGAPGSSQCATAKDTTLQVCQHLGVPVAMDKLEFPRDRTGLREVRAAFTTKQIRGAANRIGQVDWPPQDNKTESAITYWETCLCSQGYPSR